MTDKIGRGLLVCANYILKLLFAPLMVFIDFSHISKHSCCFFLKDRASEQREGDETQTVV